VWPSRSRSLVLGSMQGHQSTGFIEDWMPHRRTPNPSRSARRGAEADMEIGQTRGSSNGNENAMSARRGYLMLRTEASSGTFQALHHRESQKKAASCRDR